MFWKSDISIFFSRQSLLYISVFFLSPLGTEIGPTVNVQTPAGEIGHLYLSSPLHFDVVRIRGWSWYIEVESKYLVKIPFWTSLLWHDGM